MKKFLIILLALVLAVFAVGCNIGTYKPGITNKDPDTPPQDNNGGTVNPKPPVDEDDPDPGKEEEGYIFTVTLIEYNSDGEAEPFYPPATMTLYAQWIGADGAHNAKIEYNGTATIRLDGEYRVSLAGVPDNYTYNPNVEQVNNNDRDRFIEMLPVTTYNDAQGALGKGEYNCIRLNKLGTYRIELKRNETKYFEYYPTSGGIFFVESIADAMANEVNPKIEWNLGNSAYKNPYTYVKVDDGGYSGSYTKNFLVRTELQDANVGSVVTLAISAEQVGNNYPVEFYFSIYYGGKAEPMKIAEAKGPFYNGPHPAVNGTWQWSYRDNPTNNGRYYTDGYYAATELNEGDPGYENGIHWNNKVYDYQPAGRIRRLFTDVNGNGEFDEWIDLNGNGEREENEIGLEGDGFYHIYDPERYPKGSTDATGTYPDGYGPLVWAVIGGWDEIFNRTVQGMDDSGREIPVDVDNLRGRAATSTVSYIPFIEAYAALKNDYTQNGYHTTLFRHSSTDYDEVIHPVNEEMKEALNKLALSLGYYNDGEGNAENIGEDYPNAAGIIVSSGPDDMWLIFCGYYVYNYENVGD